MSVQPAVTDRSKYWARKIRGQYAKQGLLKEGEYEPEDLQDELEIVYNAIEPGGETKREEIVDALKLKCRLQNSDELASQLVTEKLKILLSKGRISRTRTGYYTREA